MKFPLRWLRSAVFHLRCWIESHRHGPKLRKLRHKIEKLAPVAEVDKRPVYFFNASTRTWGLSQNAAFSLLASWGLRLDGIPIRYFVCMRGMQQCMLGTNRKRLGLPPPCKSCMRLSKQMYPGDLLDAIEAPEEGWSSLPDFSEHGTLESLLGVESLGLKIGELCLPSLRWVLRRHNIPDTAEVRDLFRKYLRSAIHVAETFIRVVERTPPRAVVVFNGITFPEVVVRQIALQRGIPVITHEVGVRPFSVFFTHGEATAYPIEIDPGFQLSPEENNRLEALLSKRFQGDFSMAGIRFWPEMRGLEDTLEAKLEKFEQTVAVFTNVIFDTSQVHANATFTDMFAWLRQVIHFAVKHPSTLFVIRAHPDELRPGKEAQETVGDVVSQMKVDGMENVAFIPPLEFVSSYDLIRRAKLVMVYNSSIGLEATLLNRVVLCGGASRYSRYPTVYLLETPKEYFSLAGNVLVKDDPKPPASFVDEAKRFYYVQHFLTSLDYASFLRPHKSFPGYVSFSDFDMQMLHPVHCRENEIVEHGIRHGTQMFYDRRDVDTHASNEISRERA